MKKVGFYIDGFNFYYGLKKSKASNAFWQDCYWINISTLCNNFLDPAHHTLEFVKYFTAPPLNRNKRERQQKLLTVNLALAPTKFKVINGKYIKKNQVCPHCNATYEKPEEKRTDVNIAVNLMGDAALKAVDIIYIISADSDLVPPVLYLNEKFPSVKVKCCFPPGNFSHDLKNINGKYIKLESNKSKFRQAMLNKEVLVDGITHTRPDKWD